MITKPILNAETQEQIDRVAIEYTERATWTRWGLENMRGQGAAVLFYGPPGTGKTTAMDYLALGIRAKGIKELNMAAIGSQVPGEGARQVARVFAEAKKEGGKTVKIDEAEALVFSRKYIGGTNTWMLEIINAALTGIAEYPHLTCLATNRADMLDDAIERRLIAKIYVGLPNEDTRLQLWAAKIPKKFPYHPNKSELNMLSKVTDGWTGARIEKAILNTAKRAIIAKRLPTYSDFMDEISFENEQIVTSQSLIQSLAH